MMKYFGNHSQISELKFSNNHYNYGSTEIYDDDIFKLCDNLFFYLKILHKAGIILGDVNPENILIYYKHRVKQGESLPGSQSAIKYIQPLL